MEDSTAQEGRAVRHAVVAHQREAIFGLSALPGGFGLAGNGILPGISMHTELELLVRLGLSPREALAAATNNYASSVRLE